MIPGGNLDNELRHIVTDDDVLFMCDLHEEWKVFSIILYVESGDMPIRVLQPSEELSIDTTQQPEWVSDASISLGDAVSEGVVVNGEHLNVSDLDWLDDGLEGLDFIDDIFVESINFNESTRVNDSIHVDKHTPLTRPLVNVNATPTMLISYVVAEDECEEKHVDDELNNVYVFDDGVWKHYRDFNVQTNMQKVELVNGMKFPNS